jgi:TP901-1 family phage major tail protein
MDGSLILVLVETAANVFSPVAQQTGLSWESTRNLIEATSKDSDHTKWVYGKKDDTVSLEAAYVPTDTAYQALKTAMKDGTMVILRRSEDGDEIEEAEALVSSISGDAPDGDKATISIEFQLNEEWQVVPVAP